jgi:hypothetical protein
MIRTIRIWLAVRRLNRLVARNRDSYECQRFRERRAAALKATRA